MEVVVHEVPHRIWVGLDLVANDARPGGRVDHEKVSAAGFDAGRGLLKGDTQAAIALVGLRDEERVRVHGDDEGRDDAHAVSSLWRQAGHSTIALPVPMTVPYP